MKRLRDEWNAYLDSWGWGLWVIVGLIASAILFTVLAATSCPAVPA